MINTLLIANRGEIVLRVARTARAMGIEVAVIHTDLDAEAPHVMAHDDPEEPIAAYRVDSYLDIDEILRVAQEAGADAVHPGYGFLSERAEFARALERAGITLVGPTAEVMDAMGRKDRAREIAVRAGVPVVPDFPDAVPDDAYPVLVKAAAGGGGKGMRIVRRPEDLAEARAAAARESASAFGDDTLLVEKYVESGRHIEVQVLADHHGSVIHLFERDCSAQRRHQKVLEEAPAPTISAETRRTVLDAAVALAREVGYTNAGTVEFLVDQATGAAYFLEMNTRLQVEHPVTEAITGIDLVEQQLRIAAGERLTLRQEEIRCEGHAIEARIYAEDSFHGFLPQAGTAEVVRWSERARVDHALESGQVVSTAYDPMLGKVIVHGEDREEALDLLVAALDDTAIFGLTTNVGYVRVLADSPEFRAGGVDTAWLDRTTLEPPEERVARQMLGLLVKDDLDAVARGPWQPDGYRMGADPGPLVLDGHDASYTGWCTWDRRDDYDTVALVAPDSRGFVRRTRRGAEVICDGQRFVFDRPDPFADTVMSGADGAVTAPMPGTVLDVRVAEGQNVADGDTLGVMEAMKMELALKAPFAGTVAHVDAVAGGPVPLGHRLFEVTPAEEAG